VHQIKLIQAVSIFFLGDRAYNPILISCLEHHHIFVGDLAPEIDQNGLREAFSPFGEIS
jgi:RNA recognition motif-containing protein